MDGRVGGPRHRALRAVIGEVRGLLPGSALKRQPSQCCRKGFDQCNHQSTQAAYERRRDEWQFQLTLAKDDALIGDEQVAIATDDVDIANQEKSIADLQHTNAVDVVEFLTNQFGSAELFDWMSGILERVYSYFLRQAAVMARLGENQVAFERQEVPTAFIQADYWAPPTYLQSAGSGTGPDRKGLTGQSACRRTSPNWTSTHFSPIRESCNLSRRFHSDGLLRQSSSDSGRAV